MALCDLWDKNQTCSAASKLAFFKNAEVGVTDVSVELIFFHLASNLLLFIFKDVSAFDGFGLYA